MSEYIRYSNNTNDFWLNNIKILFQSDKLVDFFPTNDMSYNEKLNSIMRFGMYLSLILFLLKNNYLFFYIPIFLGVFTYFLHQQYLMQKQKNIRNREKFSQSDNIDNKKRCKSKVCQLPSYNNPFMNVLLPDIKYRPRRPSACRMNSNIKKDIEDKFDINLYKDISDIYGKSNSQRQYYTMPSTTIPNDQEKFSRWLYATPETCKEGNAEQCVANIYENILADTPFKYKYIN